MSLERPGHQDFVIIGATGDLSRRKLLPALYNLHLASLLPETFSVVGFARSPLDTESFKSLARDAVKEFSRTGLKQGEWRKFEQRLSYVRLTEGGYMALAESCQQASRVFYLATPPDVV